MELKVKKFEGRTVGRRPTSGPSTRELAAIAKTMKSGGCVEVANRRMAIGFALCINAWIGERRFGTSKTEDGTPVLIHY